MNTSQEQPSLQNCLSTLKKRMVIPQASNNLDKHQPALLVTVRNAIAKEVPAFALSGNPEILPGLALHTTAILHDIRNLFAGEAIKDFDFVASHARLRAEQRFPLEAILHAYRVCHRLVSHWLRDAALTCAPESAEAALNEVADFASAYTNIITSIATSEYVMHTRMLAETQASQRTELLNILLAGYDESDARIAKLLRQNGYLEQRQSYCVLVVRAVKSSEMEQPQRVQRIISTLTDLLATTTIRLLAGVRDNLVVAVLSDRRRQSGWTPPQTNLYERLAALLEQMGPSVLVGIGSDHHGTAFVPKSMQQANIALDVATVARRVVLFNDLPLRSILVRMSGVAARTALPNWHVGLVAADLKSQGKLIATLRSLADHNINVQLAGRAMGVHPNTIYARIERIKALTDLDARGYHALSELLLAIDCAEA